MWKKVIFWSQETQTPAWPKPWLWVKCENRSKGWVDFLLSHRQCWQWKLFVNYYYFVNYLLNYLLSSSSNMSSISFSHSAFSSLSTTSKSWIDKKNKISIKINDINIGIVIMVDHYRINITLANYKLCEDMSFL